MTKAARITSKHVISTLVALGPGSASHALAEPRPDTSIGAIATVASPLILEERAAVTQVVTHASHPNQATTYTLNVSPTATTLIAGLVEYNPTTCTEVSSGTWTVNTAPKHGTTTIGTLQGTLSNGSCPSTTFTFGTISYTPTDKKATKDDFAATWVSPDYNEPFDFDLLLPHVTFVSQDISTNSIVIDPEPAGLSGSLTILAIGGNSKPTVATQTVSGGGTVALSYGETTSPLPPAHYTSLSATWASAGGSPANTITVTGTTTVNFTALGLYQNTQYNFPAETRCSGTPTPVTLWSAACVSSANSFKSGFIDQFEINGTGIPHMGNYVHFETSCASADDNFAYPYTPAPSCSGQGLSATTIAVNFRTTAKFQCGDNVLFVGEQSSGTTIGITKTVTDTCPACNKHAAGTTGHVDNFTTDTACHEPSLANYQAIILGK